MFESLHLVSELKLNYYVISSDLFMTSSEMLMERWPATQPTTAREKKSAWLVVMSMGLSIGIRESFDIKSNNHEHQMFGVLVSTLN